MRILILEIDGSVTRQLVRFLDSPGTEFACFDDGNDAVAWLLDNKPDLIVSSPGLRSRSGILVVEWIRLNTDYVCPIVMFSNGSRRLKVYMNFLGVSHFLQKPFSLESVSDCVADALHSSNQNAVKKTNSNVVQPANR